MQGRRVFVAMLVAFGICGTGIALGAQDDSGANSAGASALSEPPTESPGPELKSERTATSQTFRLPDGARETRIFENPINYRDAEGDWKPIEEGFEEEEGASLGNGANRFDVQLPTRMGDGSVRLSIGNQWISYRLLGLQTEAAELQDETASYETASSGLSFDLASLANGLKENIEIADPSQPSSFDFELNASNGLTPTLAEDGTVDFRDEEGHVVIKLPAPVISDSSPEQSVPSPDAVHYKLQSQGEGQWLLGVEADREWLQQPDRVWPVRIDPTVVTIPKPTLDCNIFNGQSSNLNLCGYSGWKLLGAFALYKSNGADEYARSLLQFDLSSIPSSAWVSSATLGLYAPSSAKSTAGVQLRRTTNKPWTKAVNWVTYNGGDRWEKEGGDSDVPQSEIWTTNRGSQAGWWNFDLTKLTRGWVTGSYPNQGVLLKLADEAYHECNGTKCTDRLVEFSSSAATDTTKRPYLSITYLPAAPAGSKLTSPTNGTRSAKRFKLQAGWSHAGVTGVYFQFMGPNGWTEVPASQVTDKNNKTVQWPLATEGAHESPAVYWNAPSEYGLPPYVLKSQIRAILVSGVPGAEGYTAPAEVELDQEIGGPKDATAQVGPGSVNLLTGNFTMSRTDVSIAGFGSALEFSRTHNSRDAGSAGKTGVLGQGWKPGVAVEAAGGAAWRSVRMEVATEEVVTETENAEGEIEEKTTIVPIGEYALLTDLEGHEYAFEKTGESTFKTPPEAAGRSLSRQGSNLLLSDPGGNSTTFSKASGGNEYLPVSVSQTGGPGNKTQMIYQLVSGKRRLSMMIAPSASQIVCNEAIATTTLGCRSLTFSYQPASNWGAPAEMGDRLASITYHGAASASSMGSWQVASYAYNAEGRLTQEWDPRISPALKETYSYESAGRLQTITPPGEEPWTLEYGTFHEALADGRLIAVKRPSLLSSPSVAQTTIAYGVPITGSGAPYDMSAAAVAQWGQQDVPTDATAIFPPDEVPSGPPSAYSKATIFYMDVEGQQVNTATPSGAGTSAPSITTAETDEYGDIVRELSAQNRLRALATGSESVTRSHELETKRLFSADGTQMEEEWGPLHQVRLESGTTVQARLHTTIQYDEGWPGTGLKPHLPTRETTGASIPGQGTDADLRITETKYSWSLRQPTETIVDPSGVNLHTRVEYDPESGLPTERRLPANPGGGDAHTTKVIYYVGEGVSSPDPACKGKPAFANLPCKVMPAEQPGIQGQPELLVTTYPAYNSLGEPTEVIESPGGSGQNTRKTITTYDSAGRETNRKQEGGGSAIPKVQTLYSLTNGRPTTQRFVCEVECTGFDNQAAKTTYDKLGRPISYEDADGNISGSSYDLLGRPVTTTDGKGAQTRTYDPASGLLVKLEDSGAGTFTASYDADGNLVEEGLPDGLVAKTTYDETGAPVHLSYEKKTFCSISCTWLDFGAERSIYGQVLAQTSLSSAQQYSYDKAGRLTQVKDTPQGGGCTTRSYGYEADSNRTALVTRQPGIGGACDLSSEGTKQSYSYDAGDRLLGTGLTYDNYGRITSLPASYAGGNALTTSYYSNDLVASQSQGGITNTYQLDGALRQRQRTQTGGSEPGTEIYHYAGGSDSPAWIDRGSSWSRNVAGIGRGLVAIQDSVKGTTLQLTNLHGDVVATASPNPEATKLLASFEFDEFGNPKQGSAGKYGWLGGGERRTELPSGVVQMGVRSYVPAIGRFISTDPVSGGSANTYDYANADPVNGLDLGGTKPWDVSSVGPCTGDLHVYSPRENRVRNRGGYGKFYVNFRVRCGAPGYVVSVLKVTRRFEQGPGSGNAIEDVNKPNNPSSSHWNGEWGNWNGKPTSFTCLYGIEYQYTYEIQVQWASVAGAIVNKEGSLAPSGEGTLRLQAQEFCGHGPY